MKSSSLMEPSEHNYILRNEKLSVQKHLKTLKNTFEALMKKIISPLDKWSFEQLDVRECIRLEAVLGAQRVPSCSLTSQKGMAFFWGEVRFFCQYS